MMTEVGLSAKVEQERAFKEEALRAGAENEPKVLAVLEDIGYRAFVVDSCGPADSEDDGLTLHDEVLLDNGQFTPAMLKRRR